MKFELNSSFDDNVALFKTETEKVDPECAKILFDNLGLLDTGGDAAPSRGTISEFHKAVLTALEALAKPAESAKS